MQLVPWILMHGSPVFSAIREEWISLLNDSSQREEAYQVFLANHAGLFFPLTTLWREQLVIAKLQLSNNYVTDFVVACNDRSGGFRYTFAEIESPHTPPFTKNGQPSARLSTAVQQLCDWQRWLEQNRSAAKKMFPSKEFIIADQPNFNFLIIMGRRENTENYLAERNYYSKKLDIEIRSFDYLTDVLDRKRFESFTTISHDLATRISDVQNNTFANPFFRAYTDADWRDIVRSPKLSISHMVGQNLSMLLEKRNYNTAAQARFMTYLKTLPDEQRLIPFWEYEYLKTS